MKKIIFLLSLLASLSAKAQQLSASELFEKGDRCENYADALKWFKLSAEKGNGKAALNVAIIYEVGLAGDPKNPELAQGWYELAGRLGNSDGYFYAAKYLYNKWVNTYDSDRLAKEAKVLFQKAADLGDPDGPKWVARVQKETDEYWGRMRLKASSQPYYSSGSSYGSGSSSSSGSTAKKRYACTRCDGKGKIHSTFANGAVDSQGRTVYGETVTCSACNGKGYNEY